MSCRPVPICGTQWQEPPPAMTSLTRENRNIMNAWFPSHVGAQQTWLLFLPKAGLGVGWGWGWLGTGKRGGAHSDWVMEPNKEWLAFQTDTLEALSRGTGTHLLDCTIADAPARSLAVPLGTLHAPKYLVFSHKLMPIFNLMGSSIT